MCGYDLNTLLDINYNSTILYVIMDSEESVIPQSTREWVIKKFRKNKFYIIEYK